MPEEVYEPHTPWEGIHISCYVAKDPVTKLHRIP